MKLKFFEIAKRLSQKSDYHHKLGAVIVNKNRIVGMGFNKPNKTHTRSNHPFKTIHAELDALLGVDHKDLEGASIYVYREHKNGCPANSRPCIYCESLIKLAKIKNIYYTDSNGYKELKNV